MTGESISNHKKQMREKAFCVYILTNRPNGALYVGMTSNLLQRVSQHREKVVGGFTKDYGIDRLMWFEQHPSAESAIRREKRLKRYKRAWKVDLIEEDNPDWEDLFHTLL